MSIPSQYDDFTLMDVDDGGPYVAPDTSNLLGTTSDAGAMGNPPMIARRLTIPEWLEYVASFPWSSIRPDRLILHHTYRPDEQSWAGLASMRAMQRFYAGKGWPAAPHIYCAPDGIWLFTPMDRPGIHANAGNCNIEYQQPVWGRGPLRWYSIGVEMVGYFDHKQPSGAVWQYTLAVLGGLLQALDLPVDKIFFHRDYSAKTCPGTAVTKPWVRDEVTRWLAASRPELPYRTRHYTPVFETPGEDGVQVAWQGRAVIPPDQIVNMATTEHAGWLHWSGAGFVESALVSPVTAPALPTAPPAATEPTEHSPLMFVRSADERATIKTNFVARCRAAGSPYTDAELRHIANVYETDALAGGADLAGLLAQVGHETGWLTASLSLKQDKDGRNLHNFAGIGVFEARSAATKHERPGTVYDADPDVQGYRPAVQAATIEQGVRNHVGRYIAYATRLEDRTVDQHRLVADALRARDLPAHMHGSAPSFRQLGKAHNPTGQGWAAPGTDYGVKLARAMASLLRKA